MSIYNNSFGLPTSIAITRLRVSISETDLFNLSNVKENSKIDNNNEIIIKECFKKTLHTNAKPINQLLSCVSSFTLTATV